VGPSQTPYTGILQGSLQINGIPGILEYASSHNLFSNRPPDLFGPGGASQGFVEGDIFFFQDGISATLNVGLSNVIQNQALNLHLNQQGFQHIEALNAATNNNGLSTTGPTNLIVEIENPNLAGVTSVSQVNLNNIQERMQVPLVIILT
jgi:hypothetical protein